MDTITAPTRPDTPSDLNEETSDDSCQVYRHFDKNGRLLYVGVSLSAVCRLAQHKTASPWFLKIHRVEIETHLTRRAALDAEREVIANEKPLHNIKLPAPKPPPSHTRSPRVQDSLDDLLVRTTTFDPVYSLHQAADELGIEVGHIQKAIDAGELGFIHLPMRWNSKRPKLAVTGWQLIDYIEYLDKKTRKAPSAKPTPATCI
jgi:hypothetical protein